MRYLLTFAVTVLLGLSPDAAQTQTRALCGDRTEVISNLENRFAESRVSYGLASNGSVIEIYASPKGTFTIIVTQANGRSCLVAAGESWETMKAKVSGVAS